MNYSEKVVYKDLSRCLPDCEIISNVWIRKHFGKRHAQADFVIISKRGVLIFEVKGSQVKRDDRGQWFFGSNEKGWWIDESPFEQATSAYHAIENHFKSHNLKELFYDRVWGWGVIFPNCSLLIDGEDPLIPEELFLDKKRYPEKLGEWIGSLFDYWEADNIRLRENKGFSTRNFKHSLTVDNQEQIKRLIQPMIRPADDDQLVRDTQREIINLTEEQKKALYYHATNKLIIEGPPGTGKTILCEEMAEKKSRNGETVLFICFNRLLAEHIKNKFKDINGLTVLNYHQLLVMLSKEAGETMRIDNWIKFNEEVETLVLGYIEKLEEMGTPFEQYDYLVMDEFQDLMTPQFKSSIDLLFKGGWEYGNWVIAGDRNQAIFHDQYDNKVFEGLKNIQDVSFMPLNLNCRNTKEIAVVSHGLSGIGSPKMQERAKEPAVSVKYDYYNTDRDFIGSIKKIVNDLLSKLKDLSPDSVTIAILASNKDFLPNEIYSPGFFNSPVSEINAFVPWKIKIGTLQQFKGLEASAVLLVGVEDLERSLDRELMYVGGTRAMLFLRLLVNKHNQHTILNREPEIIRIREQL